MELGEGVGDEVYELNSHQRSRLVYIFGTAAVDVTI
jgi:hypothetical protein